MYKALYRLAWTIAVAMAFHAFYFWGGVALSPDVGEKVLVQSIKSVDTLGVAVYAGTGRSMFGVLAPESARFYAEGQVGHVYDAAIASKHYPAVPIRDALKGLPRFTHFGTPWAFLIAALLYWRREKTIKSLGR